MNANEKPKGEPVDRKDFLSNIQNNNPNYQLVHEDQDDFALMRSMNLPTRFLDRQEFEGGYERKHYCNLCKVYLSTDQALDAHLTGGQHLKARVNLEKLQAGKIVGTGPSLKFENLDTKIETQVKPPSLRDKLMGIKEPVIGLKFITEILSYSKFYAEPQYKCSICKMANGDSTFMLQHLLSHDHKIEVLKDKHKVETLVLPNFDMEVRSMDDSKKLALIRTVHSDELYPWGPGKAPWCIEQGGTGNVPTSVRNREKGFSRDPEEDIESGKNVIFNVKKPPRLNSERSLAAHYQAASELLDRVWEFQSKHAKSSSDISAKELNFAAAKAGLNLLGTIETDDVQML